jgi:hypothetical protein
LYWVKMFAAPNLTRLLGRYSSGALALQNSASSEGIFRTTLCNHLEHAANGFYNDQIIARLYWRYSKLRRAEEAPSPGDAGSLASWSALFAARGLKELASGPAVSCSPEGGLVAR